MMDGFRTLWFNSLGYGDDLDLDDNDDLDN